MSLVDAARQVLRVGHQIAEAIPLGAESVCPAAIDIVGLGGDLAGEAREILLDRIDQGGDRLAGGEDFLCGLGFCELAANAIQRSFNFLCGV